MARTQPKMSSELIEKMMETSDNEEVNTLDLNYQPEMPQTVSISSESQQSKNVLMSSNNRDEPSGSGNNKIQSTESKEMCLSNWVLKLQEIKSFSYTSKFVIILSGN